MPVSRFTLLLLLLALGVLLLAVHLELLTIAFHKLGLSRTQAGAILIASVIGSFVNLPLFRMRGIPPDQVEQPPMLVSEPGLIPPYQGVTVVCVNAGGCLVPVILSLYLLGHTELPFARVLSAIATVTAVCYFAARPIPGVGIGMPAFVAPLAAVAAGIAFGGEERALTAYVAGTTGVLIGADILRIDFLRRVGVATASIGGAGTFDGIFFTGLFAALIA